MAIPDSQPKFRLDRGTWTLAVLFLAWMTLGASTRDSPHIVVESLTIADESGEPRIVLSLDRQDRPSVQLFGSYGNVLASLEIGESDEPRMALHHPSGATVLELALTAAAEPHLTMYDLADNERVHLRVESDGAPLLEMTDSQERQIAVEFNPWGSYGLIAYDAEFDELLRLGVDGYGDPSVGIFNAEADLVASFALANDRPYLTFWNRVGELFIEIPPYVPEPLDRPYDEPERAPLDFIPVD